jgi:hypothetical protein
MEDNHQKGENQLHKDKVGQNTEQLSNEAIERMPDSDDDYRLPRELPEADEQPEQAENEIAAQQDEDDELIDGNTDISPTEIAMLEDAGLDLDSDEAIGSDLLDDTDEDGDPLNEGPDEGSLFDTGEDLDMSNDINNPDIDEEDEEY